jgi:hypothetical protein
VTLQAALRLTPTSAEEDRPEARELRIMLTNCFRKFSFLAGTVILAACLWILAGTTASAQSSGDGDLQANVASALTHDAMLKNQPVTAYTANGVVTLTGTVETEQQRQEAETVAANVKGVSGIQNNITVTGSDLAAQAGGPQRRLLPRPMLSKRLRLRRRTRSSPQQRRIPSRFLPHLPRTSPRSRQPRVRRMRLIRREATDSLIRSRPAVR